MTHNALSYQKPYVRARPLVFTRLRVGRRAHGDTRAMADSYTLAPGQAPVKREYIRTFAASAPAAAPVDDDAAEAGGATDPAQAGGAEQPRKRQCAPAPTPPAPAPDA